MRLKFELLINVKKMVGILAFMSRLNYWLWLSLPEISIGVSVSAPLSMNFLF